MTSVPVAAPAVAPVLGRRRTGRSSVLPGFGLSLGVTLAYLTLLVLVPLAALVLRGGGIGVSGLWALANEDRVRLALRLSFGLSLLAALVTSGLGLLVAWVLVRYRFPGRRLLDALVDLPFALPTAVAGLALSALYAPNGWIGGLLAPLGIQVAFTRAGILVALVFIGMPFVVRTMQPVLAELDPEFEEASATLGASRARTLASVILPALLPALLTGFALAFARSVGEYGSVVFIAGNIPYLSEIAPVLIMQEVEGHDYAAATAIGVVMLALSFAILLLVNLVQAWTRRRTGQTA